MLKKENSKRQIAFQDTHSKRASGRVTFCCLELRNERPGEGGAGQSWVAAQPRQLRVTANFHPSAASHRLSASRGNNTRTFGEE